MLLDSDAKLLGACLATPGSAIAALLARAEQIENCQRVLREWLRANFCGAARVVNFRDGVLIVHAESAAMCTALRFRSNECLAFLNRRLATGCSQISIKVRPTVRS